MRRGTRRALLVGCATLVVLGLFVFVVIPSSFDSLSDREDNDDTGHPERFQRRLSNKGPESNQQDQIQQSHLHSQNNIEVEQISDHILGHKETDNITFYQHNVDEQLVAQIRGFLKTVKKEDWHYCEQEGHLGDFLQKKRGELLPQDDSWEKFYYEFGPCDLYRPNSSTVDQLLHDMAHLPIKRAAIMGGGTQVKMVLTLSNDKKVLFKPQRFDLSYETNPNHFYFSDFERSYAEIGAFHLDRLLGYRRALPTVGRVLDLNEIKPVAERALQKTFFISPAKNLCFVGKCDYYCDTSHAICGTPTKIRGSVQVYLPSENDVPRQHVKSLYRRTYSKRNQVADWQKDNSYCEKVVKNKQPYIKGRRLLDLVDLHILDFLIGNLDRHHFETIDIFDTDVYMVHLDNGRGFGKTRQDYVDILAPLLQCGVVRPSTVKTLVDLYDGQVTFTDAFKKSLSNDPTYPILAEKQYPAMERRLEIILRGISGLLGSSKHVDKVLVNEFVNSNPIPVQDEDES